MSADESESGGAERDEFGGGEVGEDRTEEVREVGGLVGGYGFFYSVEAEESSFEILETGVVGLRGARRRDIPRSRRWGT